MIAIVDYGVGNLFSLSCSLEYLGFPAKITAEAAELRAAERIILPGVGAFGDAVARLRATGLVPVLEAEVASGKPLLGICLGMQLLFDKSFEFGEHEGLGLISGSVVPMLGRLPDKLKIPHIGWNSLELTGKSRIFRFINSGDWVYFVHSYFADGCEKSVTAVTEYGITLTAVAENGNVFGCQFHPEKSGAAGLNILRAFCGLEDGI